MDLEERRNSDEGWTPGFVSGITLWRPITLFVMVMVAFNIYGFVAFQLPVNIYAILISSQFVVILGGALLYRKFFSNEGTTWPSLRRLGMPVWVACLVMVASIVVGLLGNVIALLVVELYPALGEVADGYQETLQELLLPDQLWAQLLGAFSVMIVAPFCEEILFRGTMLPEQRRAQLAVNAILLNGVLFALMHANPVAFVSLAIIGCFLAHITLSSGAIWGAILGHAALNGVNGVILPRLAEDVTAPDELVLSEILVALVVLASLSLSLWWFTIRAINKSKAPQKA